jgi:hypothetical protein
MSLQQHSAAQTTTKVPNDPENGKNTNPEINEYIEIQMEKERMRLEREAGIT